MTSGQAATSAQPAWWRHAVIYQVYLRSFQDSDGDGVGDLQGLIERLDYLNDGGERSLGVDAVWVSPVNRAGGKDFGYDVVDYYDVDPAAGDLETFDRLVEACHARGMRVVLDMVLNHTSERHPWFEESRSSRTAAKRDWYVWRDPAPGGGPPNNWRSVFGGSMWTLDAATGQYYLHSYFAEQPDLNWRNPEVVAAAQGVLRFWLRRGVDAFRIDAAGRLLKHPRFEDDSDAASESGGGRQPNANTYLHAHVAEAARAIRRVLDEFPQRAAIGEVYASPREAAVLYGGVALDGLQLVFEHGLIRRRPKTPYIEWRAEALAEVVRASEAELPRGAVACWAIGNHDVSRFVTRNDADGLGALRARAAALLLLGLYGPVSLYYGDELGMRDAEAPSEGARDEFGRDPQRAPMQWDASPAHGFTRGEPWLPFAAAEGDADSLGRDPDSLLSLYRRAVWARKREPSLLTGATNVDVDSDVCLLRRQAEGARSVLVAVNTAAEERTVTVPREGGALLLATDPRAEVVGGPPARLVLPSLAAAWVVPAEG